MASFADLVPLRASVTVRGVDFTLRGINETDLGQLFFRFPELEQAIRSDKITVEQILELSQKTLAGIIACSTDRLGDATEEKAIAGLALGEKAVLLGPIWDLTMPGGAGPFVDLVRRLAPAAIAPAASGPPASEKASSESSPKQASA